MAEVKKLSPTHETVIRWILENPGPRLVSRAAEFFGYTVPWMSTIMNSDAFRARLAELSDQADAAVVADIPAKLRGVASLALDALAEQVDTASKDTSPLPRQFLRETAEMSLKALGYGNKPAAQGSVVNNTAVYVAADPRALAAARERFASLGLRAPEAGALEVLPAGTMPVQSLVELPPDAGS